MNQQDRKTTDEEQKKGGSSSMRETTEQENYPKGRTISEQRGQEESLTEESEQEK